MDKEILKSALFGYSKISVCQYIATMNEEFNAKLMTEADQYLLEIKTMGQTQTQKIELYTGAIAKLREDMTILANQTDDALNTLVERFLSLRQDFEDSEL